jgi:dGTPase
MNILFIKVGLIMTMEWYQLLNTDRFRKTTTHDNIRNEFEKDYDRMISFSSVRRLQDKTQVFPLQSNDYTRTRLTHSLEVSALGRSLGKTVATKLGLNHKYIDEIQSLLSVACLVHDLGNPPFGHFGEDSIKEWFRNNNTKFLDKLTQSEMNDFHNFDGNPQTIRILTKLQFARDHQGANFTFGTLGTLIKYPNDSSNLSNKKKFGYFQSEKKIFNSLWESMKVNNRHPLTYLLEAADDIANSAADVEDAIKKKVISWEFVYEGLKNLGYDLKRLNDGLNEVKMQNENIKEGLEVETNFAVQMRVWAQGVMIEACVNSFLENYSDIMNGVFKGESLINKSEAKNLYDFLTDTIAVKYIYSNNEVLKLEMLGHRVINSLLDMFVETLLSSSTDLLGHKKLSGKLYHLISSNFRHVARFDENGIVRELDRLSMYDRVQLAVDFVAGMTDTYALEVYQELNGVKLP